ncbi:MAG: hypothetical protein PWQ47_253 [Methanothermococcus sp.]|nr:hypothetical protein [Methanothermococcus sp.]
MKKIVKLKLYKTGDSMSKYDEEWVKLFSIILFVIALVII